MLRRRDARSPAGEPYRSRRSPARSRIQISGCRLHLLFLPLRTARAEILAGLLIDLAHAQLDFAAIVEAEHFDLDGVAELDDIRHLGDPLRRKLADMHQPIARSEKVHECSKVNNLYHLSIVDDAGFGLGDDPADPIDCSLCGISVDRGDLDGAVVFYVDLSSSRLGDLPDDLTAGPDDFADLFLGDAESRDPRSVCTDGVASAGQGLGHLGKYVSAALAGLLECNSNDLLGYRGDLDVHLQRGDAPLGAGDLEVHVAEVILVAKDIRQHGKAFRLFDQPHSDPGHRTGQRDAGVHQRKGGAANRGHGRRPVRFRDLGDDAYRVGEAVLARQQRADRTPRELAMPHVTPARRAQPPRFAGGIGREIVVEHEILAVFAFERIDHLLVLRRSERSHDQRLGLASRKQRRAVGTGQKPDLARYCTNGASVPAIDPVTIAQNGAAHDVLFDVFEELQRCYVLPLVGEQLGYFRFCRIELVATVLLALGLVGGFDQRAHGCVQLHLNFAEFRRHQRQAPRLAGTGFGELDDSVDDRLKLAVTPGHSAEHYILGKLLGFGFDHQDPLTSAGDDEVEVRARYFGERWIEDVFAVDIAYPGAADRAQERDARDRQRRRGADHRDDVGLVFEIMAENRANDLGFVDEAWNEERPQRAVDEPRYQRLFFGRPALALEEAARDLASGKGLLLIVDREWKKVLARLCGFHRHCRAENRRVAIGCEHRAIGLAG